MQVAGLWQGKGNRTARVPKPGQVQVSIDSTRAIHNGITWGMDLHFDSESQARRARYPRICGRQSDIRPAYHWPFPALVDIRLREPDCGTGVTLTPIPSEIQCAARQGAILHDTRSGRVSIFLPPASHRTDIDYSTEFMQMMARSGSCRIGVIPAHFKVPSFRPRKKTNFFQSLHTLSSCVGLGLVPLKVPEQVPHILGSTNERIPPSQCSPIGLLSNSRHRGGDQDFKGDLIPIGNATRRSLFGENDQTLASTTRRARS